MTRAAIFVGADGADEAIEQCREACRARGWEVDADRIAVLDPDHPDQGLPVVLFTSASRPVEILVIPTWDDVAQGLWGSAYHTKPDVKGRSSRLMASGLRTFEAFFSALQGARIRLYIVDQDSIIEPETALEHLEKVNGPLMESMAQWDAEASLAIREGQSRAWARGKHVGRPKRGSKPKDDDATGAL